MFSQLRVLLQQIIHNLKGTPPLPLEYTKVVRRGDKDCQNQGHRSSKPPFQTASITVFNLQPWIELAGL